AEQVLEPALVGQDQGGQVVLEGVVPHLGGQLHAPGVIEGAQREHDPAAAAGAHGLGVTVGDVAELGGGGAHLRLGGLGAGGAGAAPSGEHEGGGGQRDPGGAGDVGEGHGAAGWRGARIAGHGGGPPGAHD